LLTIVVQDRLAIMGTLQTTVGTVVIVCGHGHFETWSGIRIMTEREERQLHSLLLDVVWDDTVVI
tara:strand:- start:652 stop:846 length:195 start_codon:yes stop_codon:yes gene_type:complete